MPSRRQDTRGIIDPRRMAQHVTLHRYPVPAELAGLLDWVWAVAWDVPAGQSVVQEVLSQPGVNVSVGCGPPEGTNPPPGPYGVNARVVGVATKVSTRVLTGAGWNVAAKTSTGGFGGFVAGSVADLTDRTVGVDVLGPAASLLSNGLAAVAGSPDDVSMPTAPLAGVAVSNDVHSPVVDPTPAQLAIAAAEPERARRLITVLLEVLAGQPLERVRAAREVAAVARVAEHDRDIRTSTQLARHAGVTVRTLQRLFVTYAGVPPAWVIRRWRLIEAAELVAQGQCFNWAAVAAELGYADQSHLIRDFRASLGMTPDRYARSIRAREA